MSNRPILRIEASKRQAQATTCSAWCPLGKEWVPGTYSVQSLDRRRGGAQDVLRRLPQPLPVPGPARCVCLAPALPSQRDLRGLFFLPESILLRSRHFLAGESCWGSSGCGWSSGRSGRRWGTASLPPTGPRLQTSGGWTGGGWKPLCSSPFTAAALVPTGAPGECGAERSGCPPRSPMPGAGGAARGPRLRRPRWRSFSGVFISPDPPCGFRFNSRRAGAWGWRTRRSSPPPADSPTSSAPCPPRAGPTTPAWSTPAQGSESGIPAHPQPGLPPPAFPRSPGRATSNAASSPPRLVPATEHAQSCPPPPPTSFNMGNQVLWACREEMGGLGFVWRSENERGLGETARGANRFRRNTGGRQIFAEVSGLLILSPVGKIPLQGHSRYPPRFVSVCLRARACACAFG